MDEETTKNIQIVEEKRVTEQKWAGSNSVILRDDFDSGPVSLDLIEEGLYLGIDLYYYLNKF